MNLMAGWIDEEKRGILNTRPPPLPQYPEIENDDTTVEVIPPTEALEQASSIAAEEAIASDLPLVMDELVSTSPNEAAVGTLGEDTPINLEEEELPTVIVKDIPSA